MENNKAYKTKVKEFLGYDVRIVRIDNEHEYIICKDMFDVLELAKDGIWNKPKKKMLEFLDEIDEKESWKTLPALLKQGKARVTKEVDCLNIETVPIVLT